MIAFAQHGAAPPMWVNILIAAEAWGKPPWEIAGGNPILWFWRFTEYHKAISKPPDNQD